VAYGSRPYGSAPYAADGAVAFQETAGGASILVTGGPATLVAGTGVLLTAGGASIDVTPGPATVLAGTGSILASTGATIAVTGGTAALSVGDILAAGGASIAVTGGPAALTAGTGAVLTAGGASIELAGGPASLVAGTGSLLTAGGADIEITGGPASITAGENAELVAGGARLALAAGLAALVVGQVLVAGGGALAVTGGPATVTAGAGFIATAGGAQIAVEGGPATVTAGTGVVLTAGGASVQITGGTAVVTIGQSLTASGAQIAVSGGPATLTAGTGSALDAGGAAIEVTGGTAVASLGALLSAGGVALEFIGGPATLTAGQPFSVTAGGAALALTGGPATVNVTQGTELTAGGALLSVIGGRAIVVATAPYYFLRPAPGDLDALVEATHTDVVGIFEVYAYRTSLGASEWVRWSTAPLTTEPDDSLPNYEFDDRVMDFAMSSNLWASDDARGVILGESRANTAEVTLDNADGELDALFNPGLEGVREYHWRRRPARFRIGHSSWGYDDYVVVWAGHVDEAQSDGQTATMQLRDILERLDSPVNETVYEGTAWIGESASSLAIGTGSKSFVLPNLVTNGTFTTNLSGWTGGTGWAQSAGAAAKTAGTASTLAQDNLVTAADNLYRLRATLARSAGTITVTVDGEALADATFSASGTIDVTFTAAGSATDIAFSADAAFAGSLDDITVRQEPEAEPGDMANIARTSDLSVSWMWGEVASWTPATGTLVVTVATVGGSGTFSDWSIWLRGDEGGPDMAGKPVPDPLGIVRRMEPDYLGSVQGHILYRGAIGVWDVAAAYDGGKGIALSGSFPPASGEVYVDPDRGLAWVANDVTPDLPFTVDCVAGSGTYTARRVWSQPGSYSLVVPSGVTSIRFKGWAGGGGGAAGTGKGGGGAVVDTTIAVTPGESLLVVIGGAGRFPSASYPSLGTFFAPGGASALGPGGVGAGSAGTGVASTEWGGGGGGASGLKRGSTRLVVIGGGGGGAKNRNGGGGGEDGGSGAARDGKAGEDTVGGAGGQTTTDGVTGFDGQAGDVELVSGEGPGRGGSGQGGGGGGLHGGGGGASDTIEGAGAGGGGSSEDAGGTTENGSGDTPGGATDGEWDGIAGTGGAAGADGKDGRVVITWSQTLAGLDPTAGNLLRDVLRDRRGYRLIEVDESDLVSVEADAATKTFTFGASIASLGVEELDVFSLAGTSANADTLFTVQSATGTTITVKEPVTDMPWAQAPLFDPATADSDAVFADSNRTVTFPSLALGTARSTVGVTSGRWFLTCTVLDISTLRWAFGVVQSTATLADYDPGTDADGWFLIGNGQKRNNGTAASYLGSSLADGDVAMMLLDADAGKIWWGKNGAWAGDPDAGTGEAYSGLSGTLHFAFGRRAGSGNNGLGITLTPVGSYAYPAPSGAYKGFGGPTDSTFAMTLGEVDGTALADIDAVTDLMGHVLREPGETGRQVTDKILGSLGWFLDVTRHGIVTCGAFGPPAETADHTIDEAAEGSIFEIVREPAAPALWRVKAGAERCYRVHSKPEIATSTADADRRFVLSEWRENPPALGTDTDVRTRDLAAVETFFPTLFAYRASLNTRVPEWLSWFTPDRQAYRITLGPKAWAIRQGDTVAIKAPSIGIDDYVNMVVIGRDIAHADMTGRLIVWR